jgi:hypothetical protein
MASATDLIPGGYFIQVSGQSTEKILNLPGIVVVANHSAYFGYARRIGTSETVSLLLDNRDEADAFSSMMQARFSLLPPNNSPTTNAVSSTSSSQGTNKPDNWHWDQAKADALLANRNPGQSMAEAMAFSSMMDDTREHGTPEPPSEFRLPNYETGPGRPLPDLVNFYSIDDHYPDYLLCEYDVDDVNYRQSDESGWFELSLKQIRHSGPRKFPPLKWIAVIIINHAEWKNENTFEQAHKVGAIFKASDVFDSSHKLSQLIVDAKMVRHPFKYDLIQPTPGDQQRWLIVEQHAATNSPTASYYW